MPRFMRGGRGLWRKIDSSHGEGYSPNTSIWIALMVVFFVLIIAHYVVYSVAPAVGFVVSVVFLALTVKCGTDKEWKKLIKIILSILCAILCISFFATGVFGFINQQKEKEALCHVANCEYKHIEGGLYCYRHTCHVEGCYYYKGDSDSYCYFHETEQMPNINISKEKSEETVSSGIVYCNFSALLEEKNGDDFFCYAVLTLYNNTGEEVYKVCDRVYGHISRFYRVKISIRKAYLPSFETYSWKTVRELPYGLEWDGEYYSSKK